MEKIVYETMQAREDEHWWYKVRRELVLELLKKYTLLGASVLDIGCGAGALLVEMGKQGWYPTGLDSDDSSVDFCKKRGTSNVLKGTIIKLPFENNSFDAITLLDVLEHVENEQEAVNEIYRVLRPGGTAIIFVPAFAFLWSRWDVINGHFRRYDVQSLVNKFAGQFSILKTSYFNFFPLPLVYLGRLVLKMLPARFNKEENVYSPRFNFLLYFIFRTELFLLRYFKLPAGTSVLLVVRKS